MPEKKTLNEDLFYKGSSANLPRLHTCKNNVPFWEFSQFAVTIYIYFFLSSTFLKNTYETVFIVTYAKRFFFISWYRRLLLLEFFLMAISVDIGIDEWVSGGLIVHVFVREPFDSTRIHPRSANKGDRMTKK